MALSNKLIFGLGTGRCGSTSLARLLEIEHEAEPRLPWEFDQMKLDNKLAYMLFHEQGGDVGMYFLPYVKAILRVFPNARFVCLQRDKQETIDSFKRKIGDRNHFIKHDGSKWEIDLNWDDSYPKYDTQDRDEAMGLYWEEYYRRARELQDKYPLNFRLFSVEALNSELGQDEIFEFVGERHPYNFIKYNRSDDAE